MMWRFYRYPGGRTSSFTEIDAMDWIEAIRRYPKMYTILIETNDLMIVNSWAGHLLFVFKVS